MTEAPNNALALAMMGDDAFDEVLSVHAYGYAQMGTGVSPNGRIQLATWFVESKVS